MKNKELIEKLQKCDPEQRVVIDCHSEGQFAEPWCVDPEYIINKFNGETFTLISTNVVRPFTNINYWKKMSDKEKKENGYVRASD